MLHKSKLKSATATTSPTRTEKQRDEANRRRTSKQKKDRQLHNWTKRRQITLQEQRVLRRRRHRLLVDEDIFCSLHVLPDYACLI